MTIEEFLEEIIKVFRKAGIMNPENEASLLACHILSCDKTYLYLNRTEYIDEKILLGSAALINERCSGRPLAYIVGTANFYGLDITVDERVLIPRPETELMTEEAISFLKALDSPKVLDLCTGSGCIAAAIAENTENCSILATDISLRALQLARYNNKKHENVSFLKSDLFEKIEGEFDLIISNPPYVAERDRAELQKEVRDFEPEIALFSGEDGMDTIRTLIAEAGKHLRQGGLLLVEHSEDQAAEIRELAKQGFSCVETKKDLAGLDRYLKAIKA